MSDMGGMFETTTVCIVKMPPITLSLSVLDWQELGVSFKTALNEIKNLEKQVVLRTRTVGKATMYKLNLKSKQGFYIDKLIFELATKRALDSKRDIKTKVTA